MQPCSAGNVGKERDEPGYPHSLGIGQMKKETEYGLGWAYRTAATVPQVQLDGPELSLVPTFPEISIEL